MFSAMRWNRCPRMPALAVVDIAMARRQNVSAAIGAKSLLPALHEGSILVPIPSTPQRWAHYSSPRVVDGASRRQCSRVCKV
jgi:hypothetical protein